MSASSPCARAKYIKHDPVAGMTLAHTKRPNPARYLDLASIEPIERGTIAGFDHTGTAKPPSKTEYLRDTGEVIGWDDGREAEWSFVECCGNARRAFHGRPMHAGNKKCKKMRGK